MNFLKPFQLSREILKSAALKKESRLLGLDVGDRFIGLAISDTDHKTASPVSVLVRTNTNMELMADDFLHLSIAFMLDPLKLNPVQYKTAIDKFAAVNILQGYLDYANRESRIKDLCK